jgi:hypothetical protein
VDDLARVERAAKAATPHDDTFSTTRYEHGGGRFYARLELIADFYDEANREFFALCDPALVLRMVALIKDVSKREGGGIHQHMKLALARHGLELGAADGSGPDRYVGLTAAKQHGASGVSEHTSPESAQSPPDPPYCTVPPSGWVCSRPAGHEGPCAAYARWGSFEIGPAHIARPRDEQGGQER